MLDKQYPKDPVDSVVEEMAELTKELMKAHRFGLFSEWEGRVNMARIRDEIQDVEDAIEQLNIWLDVEEEYATFDIS